MAQNEVVSSRQEFSSRDLDYTNSPESLRASSIPINRRANFPLESPDNQKERTQITRWEVVLAGRNPK